MIYISHKMDEIFEICDEISVLRDGNLVMTKSTEDTDMNELITAMVGRSTENRFRKWIIRREMWFCPCSIYLQNSSLILKMCLLM